MKKLLENLYIFLYKWDLKESLKEFEEQEKERLKKELKIQYPSNYWNKWDKVIAHWFWNTIVWEIETWNLMYSNNWLSQPMYTIAVRWLEWNNKWHLFNVPYYIVTRM